MMITVLMAHLVLVGVTLYNGGGSSEAAAIFSVYHKRII